MAKLSRWWNSLAGTTRWQLMVAVATAVGLLEFRYGVSTPKLAKPFVEYGGYWLTALVVLLFGLVAVAEARRRGWGWQWARTGLLKQHWPGLAVAVAGAVFLQVNEPHAFKVLFDEHVLGGTAYNMHFERQATYPGYAYWVNGHFTTLAPDLDKRPLLYPFLVATMHDLTGYRPENSFAVNGLVAGLLLLLIYAAGAKMGGWKVGCLGQFLLIGLPLIAQNATGGGYDLLNMTMLCALLLAAWYYWRQPGAAGLDVLVMTAVLLANCRYESLLYLGALPVIVLVKWVREKQVTLTWLAALSPLLIALPLLHNQVLMQGGGYYQTTAENFMNWKHVPGNVQHAIHFMFSPDREEDNSLLLSCLGLPALLVTLLAIVIRLPQKWRQPEPDVVLLVLLLGVLASTGMMMFLFWGDWDEPIVSRFSLPLQLALVWSVMFVAAEWVRRRKLPGMVLGVLGLYSVVSSATVSAEAFATNDIQSSVAYRWVMDYMKAHADKSVLVIARSTVMFTLYGQSSVAMGWVNADPEKVIHGRDLGMYRDVWVVQEVSINRKLNAWLEYPSARLDKRLVLETLAEYPVRPEIHIRISRVVGYDPKRPAGTVKLLGETGMATLSKTDAAWDSSSSGVKGAEILLTERPSDMPAAVPTATELPEDPQDLEIMLMHQLPGTK